MTRRRQGGEPEARALRPGRPRLHCIDATPGPAICHEQSDCVTYESMEHGYATAHSVRNVRADPAILDVSCHAYEHAMNSRPYELYISLDDLAPLWAGEAAWENEQPLRAALISLELSFLLIADAARDGRPAARAGERITRLWGGVLAQIGLLGDLLTPAPPPPGTSAPSSATNLRPLCDLAPRTAALGVPARLVRQCADLYESTVEELPFLMGLEPEVSRLRAAYGLPARSPRAGPPTLPYDEWVSPRAVAEIFRRRAFNAEDRLFAATHQGVECWMSLVLRALAASSAAAARRDWPSAARSAGQAAAIIAYLTEAVMILDTMVLADYHPLRVRLRDASGAQSRQTVAALAASRRLIEPLDSDLKARGLSYLRVFRRPDAHPAEHTFIEALATLEGRLSAFLFLHYKLAARTLGAESIGSLGVDLESLIERFVRPLWPELDRARHRLGVIAGFAHGRHAGSIVSDLERAPPGPPPDAGAAADEGRIRAVIADYFDAMRRMDLDRWVGLFAACGEIESPAGSRPFRGRQALSVFFRGFMATFERDVVVTERAVRVDAPRGRAEVDWRIDVRHRGTPISYAGTERFEIAASGEILRVTVLDDPRDIARQLLPPAELEGCPLEG